MSRRKYSEHTYTRNISTSEVPTSIKSKSNISNNNYRYNEHHKKNIVGNVVNKVLKNKEYRTQHSRRKAELEEAFLYSDLEIYLDDGQYLTIE